MSKKIPATHDSTCELCPHDKDRLSCKKTSMPDQGINCCQCPSCFDLLGLLKKEIERNQLLFKAYEKKTNFSASDFIAQDILDAEKAIKLKNSESMALSYKTLKNNS